MFQYSRPKCGVRHPLVAFVAASASLLASVSHAQHDHKTSNDMAPGPVTLKFDSVLSGYKPMTDQKLGSWREANDTVARIGGWRAYLKEVPPPDAVAPTEKKSVPAAAPTAPNPHAGHGSKP